LGAAFEFTDTDKNKPTPAANTDAHFIFRACMIVVLLNIATGDSMKPKQTYVAMSQTNFSIVMMQPNKAATRDSTEWRGR
jgi:hypothetical protein